MPDYKLRKGWLGMTPPDPVKMVMSDGQELPMIRCPNCHCPRLVDYRCSGCESKHYRTVAAMVQSKLHEVQSLMSGFER